MPTFAPSIHSYGCSSSYAGPGCGCTCGSYGDAYGLPEFLETAKTYWFGPSASSASSAAPTSATASSPAATSSASGPSGGNYYEGGYGYNYDAGTKDITIVLSPKSSKQLLLTKGSTAYNAILEQIKSGVAKPIDSAALKSKRAKVAAASSGSAPSTAEILADIPQGEADPFYKKPWFPVAVVGGVAFVGLLTYALWPSKA